MIAGTYAWVSVVQRITNEFAFEPADARIIKIDGESGVALAGAVFTLHDENDKIIGRYTTDANGEITLRYLENGKNFYLKEVTPPQGYMRNSQIFSFTAPVADDIIIENYASLESLSIKKNIAAVDILGDDYIAKQEEKDFPFEFTVDIGDDPNADYAYHIYDASGMPVGDYNSPDGFPIAGSGSIKSGGQVYLRHGDVLVFENVPANIPYTVTEKNYFKIEYPVQGIENSDDNYGCADDSTEGHSKVFAKGSGWAGYGSNDHGRVAEGGSSAVFENKKVPDDYDITMSSLVVVDRIIAHAEDIDPNKAFEVTIVVGENPSQQYYYELVHIEDTMTLLPDYEYEYDYYNRNDPTPQYSTGKEEGSQWDSARLAAARAEPVRRGVPATYASLNPPIHYPHDNERWKDKDGLVQPNLMLSADNTINVNLHHSSAIIVYGIPVGTPYSVRQVDYRYIDGYMIDSTVKTQGVILPDLEVLDDNDPNTVDAKLLRVRADIYNYFALPIMRTFSIEKGWEHTGPLGPNTGAWPTSTTVHVVDPNSQITFDSRELRAIDNWKADYTVPKYDDDGNLNEYNIVESLPPDYVMSDLTGDPTAGYTMTNTYAPGRVMPSVRKLISGNPLTDVDFTFELQAESPKDAPLPSDTVISVKGEGVGFFDFIAFTEAGAFKYKITERPGSSQEYSYDKSVYYMTVTVEKDSSGNMHVTSCEYTRNNAAAAAPLPFVNEYKPKALAPLIIRKSVTGTGADKSKRFNFTAVIGGQTHTFTLRDGENKTFTDLPVNTAYTVTESDYSAEGYITTATNSSGIISSAGATAVFTNAKAKEISGKASLTVRKKISGRGADPDKEFRFNVTIGSSKHVIYLRGGESQSFDNIDAGTWYSVVEDAYSDYSTQSSNASGNIKSSGSVATFTNTCEKPKETAALTVRKTVEGVGADRLRKFDFNVIIGRFGYNIALADGQEYMFDDIPVGTSYSVAEAAAPGYVSAASETSGTIVEGGNIAAFTNTREHTEGAGSLIITKKVSGWFLDASKKFRFTVRIGGSEYEIFLRHGESYAFSDIPAGTVYSVVEDDYSKQDYITRSTGASGTMTNKGAAAAFTNAYTGDAPPKPDDGSVQISGKKTWIHGNNENHPQKITVYVMDGDTIAAQKNVTAADGWSYVFNMPKYAADGREIEYSISEDTVKDYVKTVTGFDIENKYAPEGSPQTGDYTAPLTWFIVLIIGVVGLRIVIFGKWRRKK